MDTLSGFLAKSTSWDGSQSNFLAPTGLYSLKSPSLSLPATSAAATDDTSSSQGRPSALGFGRIKAPIIGGRGNLGKGLSAQSQQALQRSFLRPSLAIKVYNSTNSAQRSALVDFYCPIVVAPTALVITPTTSKVPHTVRTSPLCNNCIYDNVLYECVPLALYLRICEPFVDNQLAANISR